MSVKVVRNLNIYPITHHKTTFTIQVRTFSVHLLGILRFNIPSIFIPETATH